MTTGIDEILNKKDKLIIGSMLAFIFCLVLLLNYLGYFENSKRDEVLNEEFSVTIVEKFRDKSNHNQPIVTLSNGNQIVNYFPNQNIELNIRDSLIKQKNSTNMQVYRDNILTYSINILEK